MKVDLENKPELRKKKAELLHLIAVIDFALGVTPTGSVATPAEEAQLPTILSGISHQLGEHFSSSDVYRLVGESDRQTAKFALRGAVENGSLVMVEEGRGRRPAQYRRTT